MPHLAESFVTALCVGLFLGVLLGRRGGNIPGHWQVCAAYARHRIVHAGRRLGSCPYCRALAADAPHAAAPR